VKKKNHTKISKEKKNVEKKNLSSEREAAKRRKVIFLDANILCDIL
jgi:hypothetical protein